MQKEIKVEVFGKANKIVKEDLLHPEETLMKDVYYKAAKALFQIVSSEQLSNDERKSRDEQVPNVIAFLGKRGRGKTSAMVSFYSFLKTVTEDNENAFQMLKTNKSSETDKCNFWVLDIIDAAMLSDKEYIIDVVLAKMWDGFRKRISKPGYEENSHFEYLKKELEDDFADVRKAYLTMKCRGNNFAKEIERERDMPVASGLHELATGINLKESIKKLVKDYVSIFNNDEEEYKRIRKTGYLVLAIDDVDMANDKALGILEQIRMYMSVPNVIILLTADMERLREMCELAHSSKGISEETVSEFVNAYLEKVLPINQRIRMPELIDNHTEVIIKANQNFDIEEKSEKAFILKYIAEKSFIYFVFSRRERHFLQNDSLRSLVNYFNKIIYTDDSECIDWLKSDLQERLIERIVDRKDKNFLRSLYDVEYRDVNSYIMNYIYAEKKHDKLLKYDEASLGQVLYYCCLLEEESTSNTDFVNCILLFYSLLLKEHADNVKARNIIIGNSVLGGWEYAAVSGRSQRASLITGFENRASLKLVSENISREALKGKAAKLIVKKLLDENKDQIVAWLYAMFYVNIQIPVTENYQFRVLEKDNFQSGTGGLKKPENKPNAGSTEIQGDNEVDKMWEVQPFVSCQRSIFSFMFKDFEEYRKIAMLLLDSMVSSLYDFFAKNYDMISSDKEKEELKKEQSTIIDEMQWKNEGNNVLLLNSAEILYCVGRAIEEKNRVNVEIEEGQIKQLVSTYRIVEEELKKIDADYKDMVGISTNLSGEFSKSLPVQLVLEKSMMDMQVREHFERFINGIYRINMPTNN